MENYRFNILIGQVIVKDAAVIHSDCRLQPVCPRQADKSRGREAKDSDHAALQRCESRNYQPKMHPESPGTRDEQG